jgi:glycerophosphoryl diester phosphodiesterase
MEIYGHRGAKGEAPENTLAGFLQLRQLGIHKVELDLRLSQDGELIVLHDETLNRTTNGNGHIRDHHSQQLTQLDARATLPHWPSPTGVPTLKSVLLDWPNLESIQLEVKATSESELKTIAVKLHQVIEEFELEEMAIITSSHKGFLKFSRHHGNHIAHGFVAERFCRNPIGIVKNLHCQYLIANYKLLDKKTVDYAHDNEITVSAWTVNKPGDAFRLAKLGVDSIITDHPSLFV